MSGARAYIRDWRELCELSRPMLAERIGVSTVQVYRWEKGTRGFPLRRLPQIAGALGLPDPLWLLRHPGALSMDEVVAKAGGALRRKLVEQKLAP